LSAKTRASSLGGFPFYASEIWCYVTPSRRTRACAVGVGDAFYAPLAIPHTLTVDALGFVHNAVAAGNIRLALYADNGFTIAGAQLLTQTADTPPNGVNRRQEVLLPASYRLNQGLYWIVLQIGGINDTFYVNTEETPYNTGGRLTWGYFRNAGGYGAFENPQASALNISSSLAMYVRVLSIP